MSTDQNSDVLVADTELRAGGLRLPAILMQSITSIAPALGLWFVVQFLAGLAGVAAPLTILVGFAMMLMAGAALTQLAKVFPSAGGYYTLISRTVHPRAGFMTRVDLLHLYADVHHDQLPLYGQDPGEHLQSTLGVHVSVVGVLPPHLPIHCRNRLSGHHRVRPGTGDPRRDRGGNRSCAWNLRFDLARARRVQFPFVQSRRGPEPERALPRSGRSGTRAGGMGGRAAPCGGK